MSGQQKWILSGVIGGLFLLLFPPFLYGPSGAGRQWHFFLDSRRTSYTTTQCYDRIKDEPYPYSARIAAFLAKCTKDQKVERGQEGKGDVVFLLLALTTLGGGGIPFRGRVFTQPEAAHEFLSVCYFEHLAATALERSGHAGAEGD